MGLRTPLPLLPVGLTTRCWLPEGLTTRPPGDDGTAGGAGLAAADAGDVVAQDDGADGDLVGDPHLRLALRLGELGTVGLLVPLGPDVLLGRGQLIDARGELDLDLGPESGKGKRSAVYFCLCFGSLICFV